MTCARHPWLLAIAGALVIAIASLQVAPVRAAPPSAVSALAQPLTPGSSAIVRADGDCLRLREQPGVGAAKIACLPEATTVVVLPATQEGDGYRWQLVNTGGLTGWVADLYLRPYDGTAASAACSAGASATYRPGFTGFVPTKAGTGLVIWGGGTVQGVDNTARTKGCNLTAVWTNRADGEMVGYLFGAPDFANRAWQEAFPDGRLEAGRVLLLVCDPPNAAHATIASITVPGATASAPKQTGTQAPPALTASSAVVIDGASGAVLFGRDAHEPLPPASLTKIATAILAIENTEPDAWVVSDVDSRKMIGSSIVGLIPGDCFQMSDMLYGLLLPSGNDAALAIARYTAGSDAAFVQQMNMLLARLGLTDSHFTDPDGLGSPQHLASAYDIAMLSRYAMSLAPFRDVVDTKSWTAVGSRDLSMLNVNAFLRRYTGADGVKTGYTEAAGHTLSASATRDGHRLYAVVMNDTNYYADAQALMDWAFANFSW